MLNARTQRKHTIAVSHDLELGDNRAVKASPPKPFRYVAKRSPQHTRGMDTRLKHSRGGDPPSALLDRDQALESA
uniref:Uncharacterized protein n=1 Tax=Anopheles albimanus TaxID=7167 RepID=A0A182FWV3_ANOAL